jgi:ubiquinone/menaquinone biosynthesis C-methylase UbiE
MKRVDYDDRLYAVYAQGRALAETARSTWLSAFERRLPRRRPLTLIDVGSGTGRWTPALALRFGGPVFGVEPSAQMRAVATTESAAERVTYLAGSAERIPLDDRACDSGLAFFVWHHVRDHRRAAAELRRVIRPGGRLLVRTNFSDRMPELWWYRYVPRARIVDRQMFRTVDAVIGDFTSSGWRFVALDELDVETAESRREGLDRLRLRAISTFEHLSETELVEGFAAIERALAAGEEPEGPVVTRGDLLVLERAEDADGE